MIFSITRNEVLFEDEEIIAINKPHGLLVHRTKLATESTEFALQLVRKYVGHRVYPCHRLDRKTSGVLLFAKTNDANKKYQQLFREYKIKKTYLAIVRGFVPSIDIINYPLQEGIHSKKATTSYKCVDRFEIPFSSGKFETSRYSLVELTPTTGRFHQIRKHMAHVFHPVIGDRPHGCNKQNKFWKEKFEMTTMLLHASSLKLHLENNGSIEIKANPSYEFNRSLEILNKWQLK